MKAETFTGNIESAYGKTLPTPIKFSGSFDAFETVDELRSANEFPSNDEIVSVVNAKRKANKRQQAMTAALDAAGIEKPTLETDQNLQVSTMVKALVASGKYNEEQATQVAKTALGIV